MQRYKYEDAKDMGSERRHRNRLLKDLDFIQNTIKDIFRTGFLSDDRGSTFLSFRRSQKYRKVYEEACGHL